MSRATSLFLAAGVLTIASACSEETIILASVPEDDAGVPGVETRCTVREDCARDAFCDKVSCGDAAGTCRRLPTICPPDERPVCGCDGVTYWNDCLRRVAGVAASTGGECDRNARRCGRTEPCPPGATCALLTGGPGPEPCSLEVPGVCWVMPAVCPPSVSPDRWEACGGGPRCSTTCEAIRSGLPFRRALRCP